MTKSQNALVADRGGGDAAGSNFQLARHLLFCHYPGLFRISGGEVLGVDSRCRKRIVNTPLHPILDYATC